MLFNMYNNDETEPQLARAELPEMTKTKYDCLAYLFELCYDLMLSAASNVLQNPGFEAFTGQH